MMQQVQNRYNSQQQQQQQQYRQNNNYRFNNNAQQQMPKQNNMQNMRGRRNQRGRGGRNSFGQRPSYRDSQRGAPFKNAPNMNRMQNNVNRSNLKRVKPSELQLDRYQNAADRDVLCWIFENQGKCRYGKKCQWLHLDRETGQYIPTVYNMNSLSDKEMICPPANDKKKEEAVDKDEEANADKKEKEEADADENKESE